MDAGGNAAAAMEQAMQMGFAGQLGMPAMAMAMNPMNPMAMMACGAFNPAPAMFPMPAASVALTNQPRPPGMDGARPKSSGPPPAIPPLPPPTQVKPKPAGATVIMALKAENEQGYRVEKEEEVINDQLDVDWSWYVQLAGRDPNAVAGQGASLGVAVGVSEVANSITEVAVLFVVPDVGKTGEDLAIQAAFHGGRSYLLSTVHELYQDVAKWRCAAILKKAKPFVREPPSKKRVRIDDKVPASKVQPAEENDHRAQDLKQLPKSIIYLGSAEGLKDPEAIPGLAKTMATRFLLTLGADVVFKTLADAFFKLEGRVAYRKSLVYLAHELCTKRKREISYEDQKQCLEKFLIPIGPAIRAMKAREREAYCELVVFWGKHQVVSSSDLKRIKDAWDVDEVGDFDEFEDDV